MIGITMGDASGVGPEILLKAYCNGEIRHPVIVFGDLAVLEYCNELLGYGVSLKAAKVVSDYGAGFLNVIDFGMVHKEEVRIGQADERSGRAAREYVVAATKAALNGEIAAMVTLPMNKAATRLSDPKFSGHTELIAGLCGVKEVAMMMAAQDLIVTHLSTHVSLAEAVKLVKRERIVKMIELTHAEAKRLVEKPRLAVAGLNPHAGEGGSFGREDLEEIKPAVEEAQSRGIDVVGPVPPDTVFYSALRHKRYDAIVSMYHDQGHIPMKLLDFEGAVNVTLGLPIIRTSVDHGTAFDIAYKGIAGTRSFVNALEFAVKLAQSQPARQATTL